MSSVASSLNIPYLEVLSKLLSSRTSFQLEDEFLDTTDSLFGRAVFLDTADIAVSSFQWDTAYSLFGCVQKLDTANLNVGGVQKLVL